MHVVDGVHEPTQLALRSNIKVYLLNLLHTYFSYV